MTTVLVHAVAWLSFAPSYLTVGTAFPALTVPIFRQGGAEARFRCASSAGGSRPVVCHPELMAES
jgi:hypothetical protein